jgi:hypothetical protein
MSVREPFVNEVRISSYNGGVAMNQSTATLPAPSKAHATCAWCRRDFHTLIELLDHVDNGHSAATAAA